MRNKGTVFGLIVKLKIKYLVIGWIECTFEKHLKFKSVLPDPEGPETDINRRSFVEMILFIIITWDRVTCNQLYWIVLKAKWQSRHN